MCIRDRHCVSQNQTAFQDFMLHAAPVTRQQRKVTALVGCSLCSFVVLRGDGKTWPCGASGFAVFKRPPSSSNVHRFHVLSATVVVYRPLFRVLSGKVIVFYRPPLSFIGHRFRVLSDKVVVFYRPQFSRFYQPPVSRFIRRRCRALSITACVLTSATFPGAG